MDRTRRFYIYSRKESWAIWAVPNYPRPLPRADEELYEAAIADAEACGWYPPVRDKVRVVYNALAEPTAFLFDLSDNWTSVHLLASLVPLPSLAEHLYGRPPGGDAMS